MTEPEYEWRVVQKDLGFYEKGSIRRVEVSDEAACRGRQQVLDNLFADGVRRIEVIGIERREVGLWETFK